AGLPPSRATAHQPKTRGSRCPEHATPHARSRAVMFVADQLDTIPVTCCLTHDTPCDHLRRGRVLAACGTVEQ
ncbi:MAG: hypothetical protein ACRDSF_26060, partial [Pseudonocardiaceae bacterium]